MPYAEIIEKIQRYVDRGDHQLFPDYARQYRNLVRGVLSSAHDISPEQRLELQRLDGELSKLLAPSIPENGPFGLTATDLN